MGRILGIPHFLSKEAYEEEKADTSALWQARRKKSQIAARRCQEVYKDDRSTSTVSYHRSDSPKND